MGNRHTYSGYTPNQETRQSYGLAETDEGSGQQHTWFRKLETQAGRWTGPDPYNGSMDLSDPQSFNRFAYVANDPVNFIDPSGLCSVIYTGMPWDDFGCGLTVDGSGGPEEHIDLNDGYFKALKCVGGICGGGGESGSESEGSDDEAFCEDPVVEVAQTRPPPRRTAPRRNAPPRRPTQTRRPAPRGEPPSVSRPNQPRLDPFGSHLNSRWGNRERAEVTWSSPSGFKRRFGRARPDYQWHHVVEQSQTQFGGRRLNSPGNLIQIPSNIHTQISAYYSSKRDFTGNQTVRQWLRGQSFAQQHAFGMQVMQQFGAIPCRVP